MISDTGGPVDVFSCYRSSSGIRGQMEENLMVANEGR